MEERLNDLSYSLYLLRLWKVLYDERPEIFKMSNCELYYDNYWEESLLALYEVFEIVTTKYKDYDETYHLYFSDPVMHEYYRLSIIYGSRMGLKLKDNPYMKKAEKFVQISLTFNSYDYDYELITKFGRSCTSCKIHFIHGYEFEVGVVFLVEELISIKKFYADGIAELKAILAKPRQRAEIVPLFPALAEAA